MAQSRPDSGRISHETRRLLLFSTNVAARTFPTNAGTKNFFELFRTFDIFDIRLDVLTVGSCFFSLLLFGASISHISLGAACSPLNPSSIP